jgi:hypothetical protein
MSINSTNIVFNDIYIKKYILSYLFHKKCLSCKKKLENNIIEFKYLDWRNKKLMESMYRYSNKGTLKGVYVCNWCFYYVWGYR